MRVSADFLKSIDRWRHLTERLWEIRDVVEVPQAWEQSRAEKFSGDLVLTTRVLDACRPEQDAFASSGSGGLVSDPEQDYRPNLRCVFMSTGFATQEECLSLMIYLQ
jgi:hypothetical protein